MGLATRRRTRVVLVLLALVAGAAAVDTARLMRARHWNQVIAGAALPAEASGQPPELQFARASLDAGRANSPSAAASSADDTALNRYRALQDDPKLGPAARYNSANLLLRQALRVRESLQPGQAIPLIELAKETYRELLRADPGDWNARYNLERAQRLLADPDESELAPAEGQHAAERAATTMRGVSPGLP